MTKEQQFWQWFADHQASYLPLNDRTDSERTALYKELLAALQAYHPGLSFTIGGNPAKERRELVITAGGNPAHFDAVERLVGAAPPFDNWCPVAFQQSLGGRFTEQFEDLVIDPKKTWFLPVQRGEKPYWLGIKVCLQIYDPAREKDFSKAIEQTLLLLLGEKVAATEVRVCEIAGMPVDVAERKALTKLSELEQFNRWLKQNGGR